LVVISDGSKTIKNRYFSLFGKSYTHILDWYHLQEKVRQLMTMIGINKEIKENQTIELLNLLWNG
jgi:hypothetical protein